MLAHQIFVERSRVRANLWADAPIEKQLDMAEEKLKRVRANLQLAPEDGQQIDLNILLDDALDALNFIVFAIRIALDLTPKNEVASK